jgi:hypothetical protein
MKMSEEKISQVEDIIRGYIGDDGVEEVETAELNSNSNYRIWSNVRNAIRAFVDKEGKFPTDRKLRQDYTGLSSAIQRHHGGLRAVANKIGYEVERKEDYFYSDYGIILEETERVMRDNELKNVPSKVKLEKLKESGLSRAITLNGGFRKIRKEMGERKILAKPGIWKNNDYTIEQARIIIEEENSDELPSQERLKELGHYDLVRAIQKFHGGFHDFRKLLGEEPKNTKRGTWKDLENCIETVIQIMHEDDLDSVPRSNYLGDKGYNGLSSAISQYHGGMPYFRSLVEERLNLESDNDQLEGLLDDYVGENKNGA